MTFVKRTQPAPDRRRRPDFYSADELHTMLVEDVMLRHPTELRWAVPAYERIGARTGHGPEMAYQAVRQDVEARTGVTLMPV